MSRTMVKLKRKRPRRRKKRMRFKRQLGARIRRAREAQELTQPALAAACGVMDEITISRWERGVAMPSVVKFRLLVKALRTTYEALLD